MDPFTVLGASASVAQFVGYAIKFFSTVREIHASTGACTSKVTILDELYGELRDLSPRLESPIQEIGQNARLLELTGADLNQLLQHSNSINALSRICKEDCIKLLDVIAKLKGKNKRPNRWDSFRVALKTILKSNEIAELEQRLQHTQTMLTLQICAMSSTWQSIFQRSLAKLQVDNECIGSQQSKKLSTIENAIQELDNRLASIKTEQRIPSFLAADISALEKQMSLLSMASSDATKQHIILKSLHFDSRVSRYDSIQDAHKRTFSWVFKGVLDAQDKSSTGSVIRWIKYGDGIFWISGKPGSGKSTLMKFITDHDETLPALEAWSYPQPVVTASHFFWSAGSSMQKSKQGLLQTLLFDIFRQQPDLIEGSCPEQWLKSDKPLYGEPWRITDLTRVVDRIVQCNDLSVRFCFFIDGLDEFEGDHVEICQALRKLSTSPYVKLCVSSRPWNVFEDSLGRASSSKIYIHELTQNDIYEYVKDSLEEHYRWDSLDIEIENANSLIKQVTQRAAGVFLWVHLVVRELRSGLTEYDSFFDLQKRLEAIPDGLEAFFEHILESVDQFYHAIMAKTIKIALTARDPEPTAIYGFLDLENEDEDYAIKLAIRVATSKRVNPTHKTTCRRLNARTRGLLEVDPESHCVNFFHRSVIDYLSTDQMARFLDGKIMTKFDANLSILRAYTARIKNINPNASDGGILNYSKLEEYLQDAVYYARRLDNYQAYELLEHLEWCTQHMKNDPSKYVAFAEGEKADSLVRDLTLESSLIGYYEYILPKIPDYLSRAGGRILIIALGLLSRCNLYDRVDSSNHKSMLQYLLEHGFTPNDPCWDGCDRSAWIRMLEIGDYEGYLRCGIFSLMLKYGAEPNVIVGDKVAWINFAQFCCWKRMRDGWSEKLALEVLDDFKAACTVRLHALNESWDPQVQGDLIPGIDLRRVFSKPSATTVAPNEHFFTEVTIRLLSMAKMHHHDIDRYLPIIEQEFSPPCLSRIRDNFFSENVDHLVEFPVDNGLSELSRKRRQLDEGEPTYKRPRNIQCTYG